MGSNKTAVIERLFYMYWDAKSSSLSKTVMTLDDVKLAIVACNQVDGLARSDRNPANFLKDVVRGANASRLWPERISNLKYTGEQRTGSGECFEFVPYAQGQEEPFPDLFRPNEQTLQVSMQSVSLPAPSRRLGRSDEAWLIQTAVNLRVVEQHLATQSSIDVREVVHLQMNVKLRATEIDAIFASTIVEKNEAKPALVTCEAKRGVERILVGQISSQVLAAFEATDFDVVIPIAIRSIKDEGIQLIEFGKVCRSEVKSFTSVQYAKDVVYRLVPTVKGI